MSEGTGLGAVATSQPVCRYFIALTAGLTVPVHTSHLLLPSSERQSSLFPYTYGFGSPLGVNG